MKVLIFLIVALLSAYSTAHTGGTDNKGGHDCSAESKDKGLCNGYHYHDEMFELPLPPPAGNEDEPQKLSTEEERRKVADWHIIYGSRDANGQSFGVTKICNSAGI